ncbi:hypothetical protein, partial [Thomasclavelia ramosa]|uniref:hypothetical protein n=1 Tax=Thomasclavelia ramosa TaxID=1547 RepID=UPI0021F6B28A
GLTGGLGVARAQLAAVSRKDDAADSRIGIGEADGLLCQRKRSPQRRCDGGRIHAGSLASDQGCSCRVE